MEIQETTNMQGIYQIKAFDAASGEIAGIWNYKNQLTKINRDIRTAMLTGTAGSYTMADLEIKYFAFGDNSAPATVNDTKLVNERFRKPITQTVKVNESTIQTIVNLLAGEANFLIREIGVYCGSAASASKNTGTLLSRVVVAVDKNSNLVINIIRQDTVTI